MSVKILLIEDNPDHIFLTRKILEESSKDFQVDSVSEPQEGLKKISGNEYDMVLCDYRLPGSSALDILKKIRDNGNDLPFVVVTAAGSEKIAVELMKEGAYDYVVKDASYPDTLPAVVKKSLEVYNARKEKRRLEEEIGNQEVFLEKIINSLNYPFYVINLDCAVVLANQAAKEQGILGGGYCYQLTHKLDKPCEGEHFCPLREVLRFQKPVKVEHIHYDKAGNKIYVEVHGDPIFDQENQVIQMIEYNIDITERKQAEKELENACSQLKETQLELIQSSKMAAMGQLSAGISHELNQPLTGIKGFAQAALLDLENDNPLREDLRRIVEQADRMDKIIKNIHFFARKSEFKMEEIDINQPIEDSLMFLTEQLRVHNIRLNKLLALDLPKIKGDTNQLQQVFLNLITNARDAIDSLKNPNGGEITVRTSLSEDKKNIEIIFQDAGCGIPKENLESIFNPFFTTKSPEGGIGLGLSIVYRIIENHKGRIEVESEMGKGTIFKIILPLNPVVSIK
jgi:signal transduction histidine kinase/FixJ family two-component response regulator